MDGEERSLISRIYRQSQVQGALEECLRSEFQKGWFCWKGNFVRICQAARKSCKLPNHMIQTKGKGGRKKKKALLLSKFSQKAKNRSWGDESNNNLFSKLTCRQNTQSFDVWKLLKKVSLFQNSTESFLSSLICNVGKPCCCYYIFSHKKKKKKKMRRPWFWAENKFLSAAKPTVSPTPAEYNHC